MSTKKRWSEDDLIYLEYLLFDGDENSYESAAEFLNRSVSAVTKKAWRMRKENENVGFIRRNYTEEDEKYIRNAYKITPLKTMAEHLGRQPSSVRRKMKSMGLNKNKSLKEYDKEIRKLAESGCYISEIGRKLGLNVRSVWSYTKRHNIECVPAPQEVKTETFRKLNSLIFLTKEERYNERFK